MLSVLGGPDLGAAFGRDTFGFRHDLADRPELSLEALADIAERVPAAWVFAHQAQRDPHEGRGAESPVDRGALGRFVRDAATSEVSVRIYNLEHTAEYATLAAELEVALRAFLGTRDGGLHAINLGAFVASPHAVTPAHPDRHHNLLLQIAGTKTARIEDDPDARRCHLRALDYLECPPAGVAQLPPARTLVLEPGDGVYIPPYAFHWTEVHDAPAVALSVGFSTPRTVRDSDVHDFDRRLRRRGLAPRPADPASVTGRAKARLAVASRRWTTWRRRRSVSVCAPMGGPA